MKKIRSLVLISGDPESLNCGALDVFTEMTKYISEFGLDDEVTVSMVNEISKPGLNPLVMVYPEAVIYGSVKSDEVKKIVEEHLYKGRIVEEKQVPAYDLSGRIAWLPARKGTIPAEHRIVLKNVGLIDPEKIDDYIIHNGYFALGTVLEEMKPIEVIKTIKASGLRGRGGAGFPTGLKWQFVNAAKGEKKYVICNADESEPGTFKDRVILEGDPHSIIESMVIAGYAVGADEGYIYIRGEYFLAIHRMKKAIQQAREYGLLGENILNSGFDFDINIHIGAGAYICGEETALIESIEGTRGEPRFKPPFPTTEGLWKKPTLVNNVETLANIPAIILNGADWYHSIGTASSPGTKVYTMLGNVNVTGVIEVPMGITLREVIAIYAKGMKNNSRLKLAQTGGSSGSIIPASLQDTPMDFDSYQSVGVALGSGALLICNEDTCPVDLAKVLMHFFRFESCGKCIPCRIGNNRAYEILSNITEGLGTMKDLEYLQIMSDQLNELSNCGLGQTAAAPLRDILAHFRAELDAHVKLKLCPAGVCQMTGRYAYQISGIG